MIRLGVIGYGGRIRGVIRTVRRCEPEARVVAIADVRNDEIQAQMGDAAMDSVGDVIRP